MRYTLRLLVILLAVPVLAYFVGSQVQLKLDTVLQDALINKLGADSASKVRLVTMDRVCQDAVVRADIATACRAASASHWLRRGALWSGSISLGLLAGILVLGRTSRGSRHLLARLFRPGLYITMVLAALLVVVNGALVVAGLYFGAGVLFEVIPIGLVAMVGVAAAGGVVMMVRAMLGSLHPAQVEVVALPVPPEEQPELWGMIRELSARLGTEPPAHILLGLVPNFFVTEAEVRHSHGWLRGRTLYLSLPLCRILDRNELAAVVGHELGHFRGEDTQFSQRFYPIYRGAGQALAALTANMRGLAQHAALWPAASILAFFLGAFGSAEREVSRERELVADQAGAEVGGPVAAASGLVKIHAFAPVWGDVVQGLRSALQEGRQPETPSVAYAALVQERSSADALTNLDQVRVPHPTDTHPPLSQRLQALSVTLSGVSGAALQTSPTDPAIELVREPDALEKQLSTASRWRIN